MATTRATFGAVLSTIGETAAMATNVVKTGSDAVTMLNRFVESASQDQKDRQAIHRKVSRDNILREARMDMARANMEVISFCKESEEHATLYAAAEQELSMDLFDS